MNAGFSVLAWVRKDTRLLENLEEGEAYDRMETQLLNDFATLISIRWNMDVSIIQIEGIRYAYGVNTKFQISTQTLKNAIGELLDHVDVLRGSQHNSPEDLHRFKQCKARWKVPALVTEPSSGWGESEQASTSSTFKRRRF